jgi:alpha-L-fucosidase
MYHTAESDYNIVDATPFKRDVIKELSKACQNNDLKLHLYYSHLDWGRQDYPQGRTGHSTGRDSTYSDWPGYYGFMNRQLTELLTNYGPIRAIWFDGWWDHDEDPEPFNWQLDEQYAMIHRLQPGCLVGNNHHQNPFPGEDIQIFERDLPGQNTAGLSGQDISALPLETCQTMNGMWGYKLIDTNYKDTPTLIRYLVGTAGMGANLLLNIGPQPDGQLPAAALERLKDIGCWMRKYGETIYGTEGSPFAAQSWGTATRKGNRLFVHVMTADKPDIFVPNDTTGITSYYINVANAGLLQKFAFDYVDANRDKLGDVSSVEQLEKLLPADDTLLRQFVNFAARNGVSARWYYINISHDLIVNQLKALIARDVLDYTAYFTIVNRMDANVNKGVEELLNGGAAFPIAAPKSQTTEEEAKK